MADLVRVPWNLAIKGNSQRFLAQVKKVLDEPGYTRGFCATAPELISASRAALYSRAFSTQPTIFTCRLLSATRKGNSYKEWAFEIDWWLNRLTKSSAYVARPSGSFIKQLATQSQASLLNLSAGSAGGSPCTIAVSCAKTFE